MHGLAWAHRMTRFGGGGSSGSLRYLQVTASGREAFGAPDTPGRRSRTRVPCAAEIGVDKARDAVLQVEQGPRQIVAVAQAAVAKAKVKQDAFAGAGERRTEQPSRAT